MNIIDRFIEIFDAFASLGASFSPLVTISQKLSVFQRHMSVSLSLKGEQDPYLAKLVLTNTSDREIIIESITFKYHGKELPNLLATQKYIKGTAFSPILHAHDTKEIYIELPKQLIALANALCRQCSSSTTGNKGTSTNKPFYIIVKDEQGKAYTGVQRIAPHELLALSVAHELSTQTCEQWDEELGEHWADI